MNLLGSWQDILIILNDEGETGDGGFSQNHLLFGHLGLLFGSTDFLLWVLRTFFSVESEDYLL